MSAASAAGLLLMIGGLVAQLEAGVLLSSSPVVIVFQVAALALMVWARLTFGLRSFHATAKPTSGGVVTSGPYRYVRHPIYAAAIAVSLAGAAAHLGLVAAGCFVGVLAGAWVRMLSEERLLVRRYPEYRAYAARTARVIPGVL